MAKPDWAHENNGFTLLEVMMVIAIIGILAAIALPSYQRYVNEARAANFLVGIHDIALAYHDVLATNTVSSANKDLLSSPAFGQPPQYLPGLKGIYSAKHGISLSSQLVNHSGYFQYTGHEEFPVLFLRADNEQGIQVLSALDHLTRFKHTFVTPSVMMVALATPHESHRPTVAETGTQTPDTQKPEGTLPDSTEVTSPSSGTTGTRPDSTQQQASATDISPTDQPPPNPPKTPVDTGSIATTGITAAGSDAGTGLNWPPGWAMHPEKHTGQQHPGNSGH